LIDPTLENVGGQLTPLTPCFRGLWLIVIAFCLDTSMKASALLPDCSIDNALAQFFARCSDALAQLINVFNSALINLTTAL